MNFVVEQWDSSTGNSFGGQLKNKPVSFFPLPREGHPERSRKSYNGS